MANLDWANPITVKSMIKVKAKNPGFTDSQVKTFLSGLVDSGKVPKEEYAEVTISPTTSAPGTPEQIPTTTIPSEGNTIESEVPPTKQTPQQQEVPFDALATHEESGLESIGKGFNNAVNAVGDALGKGFGAVSNALGNEIDRENTNVDNMQKYGTADKKKITAFDRSDAILKAMEMYVEKKKKTDPSYSYEKFKQDFRLTPDGSIVKRTTEKK